MYDLDKGNHEVIFEYVRGYDCATARNRIAKRSIDIGADYVFMVDNDVVLPRDALINLLDEPVDVCLGYYVHRTDDNIYNGKTCICKLGWKDYPYESMFSAEELMELRQNGAKKILIHGGGMGCALIKQDAFHKTVTPWFYWVNYADGGLLSEDLYFCEQCKNQNIPVYVDARVACGHMLRHIQFPI